jgi:glycosyltransferase involved in cell wall biosynthesis
MPDHLVDVLISAFITPLALRSAIESIQAQTVETIRILVIDTYLSSDTADILAELAAADHRITILPRQGDGIADALNRGLGECTAPFVALFDANDLAAPDRLARQIAYLDNNPDCVAVDCAAQQMNGDGIDLGTIAAAQPHDQTPDPARVPARARHMLHSFLLARRKALLAAGGYRPTDCAEDTDLFWRLGQIGRLHSMPDVLGFQRMVSPPGNAVIQGRIAAINTQRAAISAARRKHGHADLDFSKIALDQYRKAATLDKMWQLALHDLDASEAAWLRSAVAAKRLEMAGLRRNELELSDCHFARAAFKDLPTNLSDENRQELRRLWAGTISRLVLAKRFAEARALAASEIVPSVMGRVVFRTAFPPILRYKVSQFLGRKASRR